MRSSESSLEDMHFDWCCGAAEDGAFDHPRFGPNACGLSFFFWLFSIAPFAFSCGDQVPLPLGASRFSSLATAMLQELRVATGERVSSFDEPCNETGPRHSTQGTAGGGHFILFSSQQSHTQEARSTGDRFYSTTLSQSLQETEDKPQSYRSMITRPACSPGCCHWQ